MPWYGKSSIRELISRQVAVPITHDGNIGTGNLVSQGTYDEGFPDVVNELPFPFAVWERHGDSYGLYGRYLLQPDFSPRHHA